MHILASEKERKKNIHEFWDSFFKRKTLEEKEFSTYTYFTLHGNNRYPCNRRENTILFFLIPPFSLYPRSNKKRRLRGAAFQNFDFTRFFVKNRHRFSLSSRGRCALLVYESLNEQRKEHRVIQESREVRVSGWRKLSDYPPFSVTHPLELTRERGKKGFHSGFQAERWSGEWKSGRILPSRHIEAGKNKIPAAGR